MNIYLRNLTVCNSGQNTYVMGLFNFFFVLQDLIDRIDSYFQRIAFQKNLLLIGLMQVLNKNKQFLFNDKPNLGKKIATSLKILRVKANFKKSTNEHP